MGPTTSFIHISGYFVPLWGQKWSIMVKNKPKRPKIPKIFNFRTVGSTKALHKPQMGFKMGTPIKYICSK